MSALTEVVFANYARAQIRSADRLLASHYDRVPMCSCGRALPCPVAESIRRRRLHFIDQLAIHDAPTVTGRSTSGGVLCGEVLPPAPTHRQEVSRMTRDPLFPPSAMLPLSEPGGVQYPVTHTPGTVRPYVATQAVPSPVEAKNHDTPTTRNSTPQRTSYNVDNRVETDLISDTTQDS